MLRAAAFKPDLHPTPVETHTYIFLDDVLGQPNNPAAFTQRYPGVPVAGVYQGQLSNKGETVRLRDAQGRVILSLQYDDGTGWPLSADGQGDSLVLVGTSPEPNNPANWRASTDPNGSPGADEQIAAANFVNITGTN